MEFKVEFNDDEFEMVTDCDDDDIKDLLERLRDWTKSKLDKMGAWVTYFAIHQGKYVDVHCITTEASKKKDICHEVGMIAEKRTHLCHPSVDSVTKDDFDQLIETDYLEMCLI